MKLSHLAKAKIESPRIKELLLAAGADTVLDAKADDFVIRFYDPDEAELDPNLHKREKLRIRKAENSALYERITDVLECLGVSFIEGDFDKLWAQNSVEYRPQSIRADQLAALLRHDIVENVESNSLELSQWVSR